MLNLEQNGMKEKQLQEERARKSAWRRNLIIYSTNFAKSPSTFKKFFHKNSS
ncbi:hypothetical protein B4065_2472 [Caldibacillus thermoamylovorans]|uniref:Uncharacterized protein n=1 Tax=Caldibacillus thermoamylovorans TaxID=35841 RepID=A0ABD4A9U9_9BACI|nr:hypothetical protein B4065_2472 [Caldibacillus thermoamylovorans]KIO68479.1 hypothetical protein B4166_2148 [Caldibacillus thermoamylovorans]KIO73425.1 hypothetical protein B4167_2148 [Caldibacillus thermoamylovorans]